MYKRISYEQMKKREVRRKRRVRVACALLVAAAAAGTSMALALNTLAAPENPEIEVEENQKAELKTTAETISGNLALPEAVEREPGVPVVVIDPGHGGEDEGCEKNGIQEKDINLAIAEMVRDRLEGMGYQAVLAREDDTYTAKEERVKNANAWEADIYVSIHQNTFEDESVEGIETWYDAGKGADNERLARLIHQETLKSTGAKARELRGDSELHVTRETVMPSCLVETGFLSNSEERGKLITSEYQQKIADGIVSGIDLYFHPKTMYLTFDDGPYVENTDRVLTILKERNIKAAFFLVGENVEKHPEMARRIVREGHTIGIHCYNHDYKALYASVESYLADFEKAREAVKKATGVEATLFRFPGGSINNHNKKVYQQIAREMENRGYIYYDWNASLEDAVSNPKAETLIQNAVSSTLGRKKIIMLAHDVVGETGQCLEELLTQFPEYRMEPLSEEIDPIQF